MQTQEIGGWWVVVGLEDGLAADKTFFIDIIRDPAYFSPGFWCYIVVFTGRD